MLNAIDGMLLRAKVAVSRAFKNERGDVNVVAIVVLIAVAVALALVFKDKVKTLLENMLDKVGQKAESALN